MTYSVKGLSFFVFWNVKKMKLIDEIKRKFSNLNRKICLLGLGNKGVYIPYNYTKTNNFADLKKNLKVEQ